MTTIKKWIAAALAACLAVSAPAQADHRDDGALAAAFVFGVATLLLLDEALDEDHGDRRERGRVTRRLDRHDETYRDDHWRERRHRRVRNLPSACLGTYQTRRHGEIRIVGERCLRRNASLLPHVCRSVVTGPRGGNRAIYRVGCLRDNGYRFY